MGKSVFARAVAISTAAILSFPLAAFGWLDKTDPTVVEVLNSEDTQFYYYAGPGQQSEWELNGGARSQTRVKGHQDLTALKFNLSEHMGKTVVAAELHLAKGNTNPVYSLAASTFNTDWSEGAGNGERTIGAPCYRWRVTPASSSVFTLENEWTFLRSDVSTAALGNFGSLVSFGFNASDTFKTYTAGSQTWIAMKLDPAVVQSLMIDQYGLMVTDARMHAGSYNPTVYTKDQNSSVQPRLLIKFAETLDTTPPGGVADLVAAAGPENGQVVLRFNAPTDPQATKAFGYTIRYGQTSDFAAATDVARWRIPRPKLPGQLQRALLEGLTPGTTYYFFVQAYDAVGNPGPIASTSFTLPAAAATPVLADGSFVTPNPAGKTVPTVAGVMRYWAVPEITKVNPVTGNRMEDGYTSSTQYDNHKKANAVWDAGTNTISLLACRNEVVGAQLLIERLGTSLTNVSVTASDLTRNGGGTIPAA